MFCVVAKKLTAFLLPAVVTLVFFSCTTIDLYEKVATIPAHQWKTSFKPSFTFIITDTAAPYQLFIVLRHNSQYNYNNIWVNLHTKSPDGSSAKVPYELPLATNERGWLGTGMDDLYEHRIALTPLNQNFYFKKGGAYTFTLEHIMREDPLQHVMNVGLRVEKKKQ
ncbi:MAG: gliding motility lipoprotein GldH [Chitinophagaceae bacterium]